MRRTGSRCGSPHAGVTVLKILINLQTQEDQIIEFLVGILQENAAETQTVICVGFAKLMLAGIITNAHVCILESLLPFGGLSNSLISPRYSEHLSFFTSPQKRRRIKNCGNA